MGMTNTHAPLPPHGSPPLPSVRRVFSARLFFIGVLAVVVSGGLIALLWMALADGFRPRGGGWIALLITLATTPVIGLAAMVAAFFARGCSACRRALESRTYRFPPTMYRFLAEQLERGGPGLQMFLRAPIEVGPSATELVVETCARCERLASVELVDRIAGKKDCTRTPERWLRPEELPWVGVLRTGRPADERDDDD